MLGLEWEQWELIGLLLFTIYITAAAAWDAGKPRRLPRRPLPYPSRHVRRIAPPYGRGRRAVPRSQWDEPS